MKFQIAAFLGDSITLGYGLEDPSLRFSTQFCRRAGCREQNYGITGTLLAEAGVSRGDGRSFLARYPSMDDAADLVVVFGGTNDYFWSDRDLGAPDSRDPGEVYGALELLCTGLREKYPCSRVVFLTPYPMRGWGNRLGGKDFQDADGHSSDAPNYLGRTLADYADAICAVCARHGFPVLDLYRQSEVDVAHSDADFHAYTLDGCHPNPAGHAQIAKALIDFCAAL